MAAVGETLSDPRPARDAADTTQAIAAADNSARIRLGTLKNLRWLAVAGQAVALLTVQFVLRWEFPLVLCSVVVAASAVLNVILTLFFSSSKRLSMREATAFLAYDTTQLAALLFLTGGIENPFMLLFLGPVAVSAATLNARSTLFLGALTFIAISLLAYEHVPLPWAASDPLRLPPLYQFGILISLILGIGFTAVYAWRIADEAARMSAALAATQFALAREHRLASLGGLAAAAAHELGTPLGTIALVARELEHELSNSPHSDDFRLLRAEAERCRTILTRLAQPEESVLGHSERLPLGALLDDIAAPRRGVDVTIVVDIKGDAVPKVWRVPEILHGLGNLVENAADFAAKEVRLRARWNASDIFIDVMDDGPGFSAEILQQIGEPYVTSRARGPVLPEKMNLPQSGKHEGMGLGFFIAKTLIEQTGGAIMARNRNLGGAMVTARWPRGAIDGDAPPHGGFEL